LVRIGLRSSHPAKHTYQIFKNRKCTANYEKNWNIGFCSAVVEVDTSDDDHADWDDDGDAAGNGAADGAEEEEDNFHEKVDHIPAGLVRVTDPSKQGVVRWGLGIWIYSLLIRGGWPPTDPLMCWYSARNLVVRWWGGHVIPPWASRPRWRRRTRRHVWI